MDIVDKRVQHKRHGTGTVIIASKNIITVKFDADGVSRNFMYPDCIGTLLTFIDANGSDTGGALILQNAVSSDTPPDATANDVKKELERLASSEPGLFDVHEMRSGKTWSRPVREMSVSDFCRIYIAELDDEIKFQKGRGVRKHKLFNGVKVSDKTNAYVFESEDELSIPSGSEITIWQRLVSFKGSITMCEGSVVMLNSDEDMGESVKSVEISVELWYLLEELVNRLGELDIDHSGIVDSLVSGGRISGRSDCITVGQKAAMLRAANDRITFIWGPPGTGKTYTLARIAMDVIRSGKRALMLSYSNVSVDEAVMRTAALAPDIPNGVIVRYGYPRNEELLKSDRLTSYALALKARPEIAAEIAKLKKEREEYSAASEEYYILSQKIAELRKVLKQEEKEIASKALFLATTASKAAVNTAVYKYHYDTVLFDEASMAYIPQIVFAAGLVKPNGHFVCIGDFKQLPPIVESGNASRLNEDIFSYCGISSAVDKGDNHSFLCLLDTQHRMNIEIADHVNRGMYYSLLKTASETIERSSVVSEMPPFKGCATGFVDLSGSMSVCRKDNSGSRFNILDAFVSFRLALDAAEHDPNSGIGLISPYSTHAKLLRMMTWDMKEHMGNAAFDISCATVHQFQGSERDVIIYDAVECYRMPYPGVPLISVKNSYADRLFNVAMTRARNKFIVVGNGDYLEKRIKKTSLFGSLIAEFDSGNRKLGAFSGAVSTYKGIGRQTEFFGDDTVSKAFELFMHDAENAQNEIRVDIPGRMAEDNDEYIRLAKLFAEKSRKGIKVVVRSERIEELPVRFREITIKDGWARDPIVIIDREIVWFGFPRSLVDFVSEGIPIKTRFRPIARYCGMYMTRFLMGLLNMETDTGSVAVENGGFAKYIQKTCKCQYCGNPKSLFKTNRGFAAACRDCGMRKTGEQISMLIADSYLADSGIRCPVDGNRLIAKKINGALRMVCSDDDGHIFDMDEI